MFVNIHDYLKVGISIGYESWLVPYLYAELDCARDHSRDNLTEEHLWGIQFNNCRHALRINKYSRRGGIFM